MNNPQIKKDLCEFLQWIKKPSPYYMIVKLSNTEYRLVTDYASGEVNVYPQDIIELRIIASKTNETCFFLHFAFGDLNRAKQLFLEMTDVLKQMAVQRDIRVLLTCSSALTTSYFAERLNKAAASMNKKMHFDAVDMSRLYKRGFNYDIVLLAPQVGYMYENASAILKNVKVCRIPGDIYGTYDVSALIDYVEKKLKGRRPHGEAEGIYIRQLRSRYKILSIPVVMDGVSVHIGSMILDHGTVVYKGEAIKKTVSCDDIEDVIRDALMHDKDIQGIGVSVPGIINEGRVSLPGAPLTDLDMQKRLEDEFHLPVRIENDVNAAALGYDSQQTDYKTVLYHFQPRGSLEAGQGIVVNHHLHHGHKNVAGEVKYLLNDTELREAHGEAVWQPDTIMNVVVQFLSAAICVLGPDVICIHSDLTPDVDLIRRKLAEHIPEEYLPAFCYIDNQQEYMALGAALICAQHLDNME